MRLVVDRPRAKRAALLFLTGVALVVAATLYLVATATAPGCNSPRATDQAIKRCVATEARDISFEPVGLPAVTLGVALMATGLFIGTRSTRALLSLREESTKLGVEVDDVQDAIAAGELQGEKTIEGLFVTRRSVDGLRAPDPAGPSGPEPHPTG